jgi:hypothetical protein
MKPGKSLLKNLNKPGKLSKLTGIPVEEAEYITETFLYSKKKLVV